MADQIPARPRIVSLGAFLSLVMAAGPFVHYAVSALGPFILSDIEMSRTAFGNLWLIGFAGAAVSALFAGTLTDGLGPRVMVGAVFGLAAAAMLMAGLAPTYVWLLLALALAGIAQSSSMSVTNALVSSEVDARNQGVLLGVKQAGVQTSQFVAGMLLPLGAVLVGWREVVLVAAAPAVVGLLLIPRLTRPRARRVATQPRDREAAPPGLVWWIGACAFLVGAICQAANVYLPLYGFEEVALSPAVAGTSAAVLGGVGAAARVLWGSLVDLFRSVQGALMFLALFSAIGSGLIASASLAGMAWLYWVGAAVFAASALSANVILSIAIVRRVPGPVIGKVSGVMSMGMYTGFMVGPVSFGALVDAFDAYRYGWLACVVTSCAVLVLAFLWRRSDRAAPTRAGATPGR